MLMVLNKFIVKIQGIEAAYPRIYKGEKSAMTREPRYRCKESVTIQTSTRLLRYCQIQEDLGREKTQYDHSQQSQPC